MYEFFLINLIIIVENLVDTLTYSKQEDITSSSVEIQIVLDRNPYSYAIQYIFTSCIIILMSYCAFWISKLKVTARMVLAILSFLITM